MQEVNTKDCYKVVQCVKPKAYNFTKDEDRKRNLGLVSDVTKVELPKEWSSVACYNDDDTKRSAYTTTTVILRGCVQETTKVKAELRKLEDEIEKQKKKQNQHETLQTC